MPKGLKVNYECPRCRFDTQYMHVMRNHFNKKKPCPAITSYIDLTDEVKAYVLVTLWPVKNVTPDM